MDCNELLSTAHMLISKYSAPLLCGIPVALIFANANYADYQAQLRPTQSVKL